MTERTLRYVCKIHDAILVKTNDYKRGFYGCPAEGCPEFYDAGDGHYSRSSMNVDIQGEDT